MAKPILEKNNSGRSNIEPESEHSKFGWAQGLALATSLIALRRFPVKALAGVLGTGVLIGIGIATYKRQKHEPF